MKTLPLINKKAFSLIEVIFVASIGAIILFSTLSILNSIQKKDQITFDQTITKIDFETTRLFLGDKIKDDPTLSNLTLNDKRVLYDGDLLIDNISNFSKTIDQKGVQIDICSDLNGKFCTNFYLKKETL